MPESVLTECPTCDVTGDDVYIADTHPVSCSWMMRNVHRCIPHDELLLPAEKTCPAPDVPEEAHDPHNRRRR